MNHAAINRRRLRWKCRRGMLELDIILLNFFEEHYDRLDDSEKTAFAKLLECEDTELFAWLMHGESPKNPAIQAIIRQINTTKCWL